MLGFTSRWALTGTPIGFGLLGTTTGLPLAEGAVVSCTAVVLGVGGWGSGCIFTATLGTRCSAGNWVGMVSGWGSVDEMACSFSPTVTNTPFSVASMCISAAAAFMSTGIGACWMADLCCWTNGCPVRAATAAAAAARA